MTFCLAIKVSEGLVGIADTRVITGNENISARKVAVYRRPEGSFFVMTSGLRSELAYAQAYDIIAAGLHQFLDGFQATLNAAGDAIAETFFALRPVGAAANGSGRQE